MASELSSKRAVQSSADEDAEELMALLDELDQIDGTLAASVGKRTAVGGDQERSIIAIAPLTAHLTTPAALTRTPQSSLLPPTDNLFSSELDMILDEFASEQLAADLGPVAMSQPTVGTVRGTDPSPVRQARVVDEGDLFQFLPFPFYPDAFGLADWQRNAASIRQLFPMHAWQRAARISEIRTLEFGHKCPLMLLMIRTIYATVARNVGVTLLDETGGEINATVHEAVFSRPGHPKPHIGMSFVLQGAPVFYQQLDPDVKETDLERHLIICPGSILRLFSNVHFI